MIMDERIINILNICETDDSLSSGRSPGGQISPWGQSMP